MSIEDEIATNSVKPRSGPATAIRPPERSVWRAIRSSSNARTAFVRPAASTRDGMRMSSAGRSATRAVAVGAASSSRRTAICRFTSRKASSVRDAYPEATTAVTIARIAATPRLTEYIWRLTVGEYHGAEVEVEVAQARFAMIANAIPKPAVRTEARRDKPHSPRNLGRASYLESSKRVPRNACGDVETPSGALP